MSKKFYWERLPEKEHPEFIEAVYDDFKKRILEYHEEYRLSDFNYKCCDLSYLMMHARQAIENGKIGQQR